MKNNYNDFEFENLESILVKEEVNTGSTFPKIEESADKKYYLINDNHKKGNKSL